MRRRSEDLARRKSSVGERSATPTPTLNRPRLSSASLASLPMRSVSSSPRNAKPPARADDSRRVSIVEKESTRSPFATTNSSSTLPSVTRRKSSVADGAQPPLPPPERPVTEVDEVVQPAIEKLAADIIYRQRNASKLGELVGKTNHLVEEFEEWEAHDDLTNPRWVVGDEQLMKDRAALMESVRNALDKQMDSVASLSGAVRGIKEPSPDEQLKVEAYSLPDRQSSESEDEEEEMDLGMTPLDRLNVTLRRLGEEVWRVVRRQNSADVDTGFVGELLKQATKCMRELEFVPGFGGVDKSSSPSMTSGRTRAAPRKEKKPKKVESENTDQAPESPRSMSTRRASMPVMTKGNTVALRKSQGRDAVPETYILIYHTSKGLVQRRQKNPPALPAPRTVARSSQMHEKGAEDGVPTRHVVVVGSPGEAPGTEEAPSGKVAMVFSEVVGASQLWDAFPQAMAEATALHHDTLREAMARFGGYEVGVGTPGVANCVDTSAMQVAFPNVTSALRWALTVQNALLAVDWPDELLHHPAARRVQKGRYAMWCGLRVRIAVHSGTPATYTTGGTTTYYGTMVAIAAGMLNWAHGGEIVLSEAAVDGITAQDLVSMNSPVIAPVGLHPIPLLGGATVFLHSAVPKLLAARGDEWKAKRSPPPDASTFHLLQFPMPWWARDLPLSQGLRCLVDPPVYSDVFADRFLFDSGAVENDPPSGDEVSVAMVMVHSSQLMWDAHPQAMAVSGVLYRKALHDTARKHRGYVSRGWSDAHMVAFNTPELAVEWACNFQLALLRVDWPPELLKADCAGSVVVGGRRVWHGLRVKIGIHSGSVAITHHIHTGRTSYWGPTVTMSARVANAAKGGEILASSAALSRIESPDDLAVVITDLGKAVKGIDSPLHSILPNELVSRRLHFQRSMTSQVTVPTSFEESTTLPWWMFGTPLNTMVKAMLPALSEQSAAVVAQAQWSTPRLPPPTPTSSTGKLSLVFTAIPNASMLWESCESMSSAMMQHHNALRECVRECRGQEVQSSPSGGSFLISFPKPFDAVRFALRLQSIMATMAWPADINKAEQATTTAALATGHRQSITDASRAGSFAVSSPRRGSRRHFPPTQEAMTWNGPRVAIGVHTGTVGLGSNGQCFGPAVHVAFSVCNVARGGEVVVTNDVLSALTSSEKEGLGAPNLVELGPRQIAGSQKMVRLHSLIPNELAGRRYQLEVRTFRQPSVYWFLAPLEPAQIAKTVVEQKGKEKKQAEEVYMSQSWKNRVSYSLPRVRNAYQWIAEASGTLENGLGSSPEEKQRTLKKVIHEMRVQSSHIADAVRLLLEAVPHLSVEEQSTDGTEGVLPNIKSAVQADVAVQTDIRGLMTADLSELPVPEDPEDIDEVSSDGSECSPTTESSSLSLRTASVGGGSTAATPPPNSAKQAELHLTITDLLGTKCTPRQLVSELQVIVAKRMAEQHRAMWRIQKLYQVVETARMMDEDGIEQAARWFNKIERRRAAGMTVDLAGQGDFAAGMGRFPSARARYRAAVRRAMDEVVHSTGGRIDPTRGYAVIHEMAAAYACVAGERPKGDNEVLFSNSSTGDPDEQRQFMEMYRLHHLVRTWTSLLTKYLASFDTSSPWHRVMLDSEEWVLEWMREQVSLSKEKMKGKSTLRRGFRLQLYRALDRREEDSCNDAGRFRDSIVAHLGRFFLHIKGVMRTLVRKGNAKTPHSQSLAPSPQPTRKSPRPFALGSSIPPPSLQHSTSQPDSLSLSLPRAVKRPASNLPPLLMATPSDSPATTPQPSARHTGSDSDSLQIH